MNLQQNYWYLVQREILVQSEYFLQKHFCNFVELYHGIIFDQNPKFFPGLSKEYQRFIVKFFNFFLSRQLIFPRACGNEFRLYIECCWHWPYWCRLLLLKNVSQHNPWGDLMIDTLLLRGNNYLIPIKPLQLIQQFLSWSGVKWGNDIPLIAV